MQKEKIVIIGAGLAGLYTAFLLQEQGYDVLVLEARNRVGGRTFTENGVDLGGQWISSLQPRVMKLCEHFGLPIYRQFEQGTFVRYFNQKREELHEKHNVIKTDNESEFTPHIEHFHELTQGNDFFSQQKHLDQISFYDWCHNHIPDELVLKTFDFSFNLLTCVASRFGSMFFWLYFLKSCGGYPALAGIQKSAQEFRIEGGAQRLSNALAADLQIIYNAEVTRVEKEANGYLIHTKDHRVYSATKIVSAIPAQLIPKITWNPNLDQERLTFYQSLKMGSVTKVVVQYETAFWRKDGYNAQIISDTPPVSLAYDACTSKYQAIVVFIVDDPGYTDQQITDQLAFLLNNIEAKNPLHVYRKNWTDDSFSGGCYFCVPPIDSLAKHQHHLAKVQDGLYFIGTETANQWMGYMEGALESAERVITQLGLSLEANTLTMFSKKREPTVIM